METTSNPSIGKQDSGGFCPSFLRAHQVRDTGPLERFNNEFSNLPPWAYLRTEEPISPELRARVKEQLIKANRRYQFELFANDRRAEWTYPMSIEGATIPSGPYSHLNSPVIPLGGEDSALKLTHSGVSNPGIRGLFNRLTSLYWSPPTDSPWSLPGHLPLSCILENWFRYHDNDPYIKYVNFFANFIRIDPSAPTTVQAIIEIHRLLLSQAASERECIIRGEYNDRPGSSETSFVRQPQSYHLKPTMRAVFIILDKYVRPAHQPHVPKLVGPGPHSVNWSKIHIHLDEISNNQTVLLVRTGDDAHLQSPINFGLLKTSGLCLPRDRPDIAADNDDVVRVSLTTAVQFISDLDRREVIMDPEQSRRAELERDEERRHQNELAEDSFKYADERGGLDECQSTWAAVRRAKSAQMDDDNFPQVTRLPFDNLQWIRRSC